MSEKQPYVNGRRELITDGFIVGLAALTLAAGAMILYRVFIAWF